MRPELLLVVGSIAACGERWTLVEPLVGDCRVQRSYHLDEDGDGWGEDGDARLACGPEAPYTALGPGDCDDGDAAVTGGGAVCPRDLVTV
ncbi:MAG TPA: hypothetical protein PKA64_23830, partial [Myxococcota bacterium]|nr:hypothetical protein [Myxococcota bacterium]